MITESNDRGGFDDVHYEVLEAAKSVEGTLAQIKCLSMLDERKPKMDPIFMLVVFTLDTQRYAIRLSAVEQVVHAVEVTPLPKSLDIVLGVVNVQGQIVPVIDIRKRFRLPEREIALHNQLILARTSKRSVAIIVDTVNGIEEHRDRDSVAADKILPHMEYLEGIVKMENGLILIHDLDRFLSLEEESALSGALLIS